MSVRLKGLIHFIQVHLRYEIRELGSVHFVRFVQCVHAFKCLLVPQFLLSPFLEKRVGFAVVVTILSLLILCRKSIGVVRSSGGRRLMTSLNTDASSDDLFVTSSSAATYNFRLPSTVSWYAEERNKTL